ncbi:17107_t:CDS:2 [Entrophospora sp. SA101]|nr:17107_t:CDS:2 [Entrophospora sp. SA101]
MSLANENSIQCEDDDDFFTCRVIHEERLNDFLVEPDFFLDDLEPLGISQEHKKFRIQIVKELIKEATQNPLKRNTRNGENGETSEKKNDNKRFRVSDIFELPATRLIVKIDMFHKNFT